MSQPVYTTIAKVKETLQGAGIVSIPDTLTDAIITVYIDERSREIDSRLPNYAQFPDIAAVPSEGPPKVYGTPKVIQRICRLLAVADALRFLGLDKHSETGKDLTEETRMNNLLTSLASGAAEIPPSEYDYSKMSGEEEREAADPNEGKPIYFSRLTRDD